MSATATAPYLPDNQTTHQIYNDTVLFCVASLQNIIYNDKLLHLKILLEIKFKLVFFISSFDC